MKWDPRALITVITLIASLAIGIRMALGARRGEIPNMIMRNTMMFIAAGIALGFIISLGLPPLFAASRRPVLVTGTSKTMMGWALYAQMKGKHW